MSIGFGTRNRRAAERQIRWTDRSSEVNMTTEESLDQLAARIGKHQDWWLFPAEKVVRGFFGTDPLFIVGDQPSTSEWPETNPNRRAFYDLLSRIGAANAHVTDLYKKRGASGALKKGIPADFAEHISLFREEIALLQPTRIVALGDLAFQLLTTHVPEVVPCLTSMWHFAYAQRYGKIHEWEEMARLAISGPLGRTRGLRATPPPQPIPSQSNVGSATRHHALCFDIAYEFSRLCFKADLIEPLRPDQKFCVITPVGTFAMTKRQFYETFPNVLASRSYRFDKIYHYPTLPRKALPFKIA